jgi:hypothetical protein
MDVDVGMGMVVWYMGVDGDSGDGDMRGRREKAGPRGEREEQKEPWL